MMYEARKKSVGAQKGHEGHNQHTVANLGKMPESATGRTIKDGTSGQSGCGLYAEKVRIQYGGNR